MATNGKTSNGIGMPLVPFAKLRTHDMCSLKSVGLHGENGLDPEISLHLYQTYVLQVPQYGMEVVLPRQKYMEMLDKFNKHIIKHMLSLPVITEDPAVLSRSTTKVTQ